MDIDILLALQSFRNGAGSVFADFLSKMTFLGELSTVMVIMATSIKTIFFISFFLSFLYSGPFAFLVILFVLCSGPYFNNVCYPVSPGFCSF